MKIYKIEAGTFYVDGGAAFGVVPKKVWQKRYPCNDENYCKIAMRCLLVDTGDRKILFDAGTGNKQLDYLKYYGFEGVVDFATELSKLGFSTQEITDVVFTHLHFDHCGGVTRYNADRSKVELVFPNASHWVGEKQWKNFLNPNVREGDSYFKENMMPVYEAGKLKLVTENMKLCPEVEMRLFDGHTVGQIVSYITDNDRTLVYVGDVVPLAANIPLAWISAYDIFPLSAMSEKKILLEEAAAKGQVLVFEHDLYTECCTVKEVQGKFRLDEVKTVG